MKRRKIPYNTIFLIIGLIALGIMVYKIGVGTIWDGLQQISVRYFGLIMGIWLVIYLLNAVSWNIIIRSENREKLPSFAEVVRLTISGFAMNYITPGVSMGGEPYKILELKDSIGANKATSAVMLYSMMHIFTHITFWIISVVAAFFYLRPDTVTALLLGLLLVVLFGLAYLFIRAYKHGLIVAFFRLAAKIPFLNKSIRKFVGKHKRRLVEIDRLISDLHNKRRSAFYRSYLVELVSRFVGCLEVNAIMLALAGMFPGVSVNFVDAVIITAGYSLFTNAVFFVPLQMGSREGGYLLAFKAIGLISTPAIIVSLVTRIRALFWIFIGLALMKMKRFKIDKND